MSNDGSQESRESGDRFSTVNAEQTLFGEKVPLVGRTEELGLLDDALARATEYLSPQMVIIQGDRGVGKTRLVDGWVASLGSRPKEVRAFRGHAEEGDGDRELVSRLLRARFGLEDETDDEVARSRLREQCQEVFDDRRMTEILHFLGLFMNLRFRNNPFLRVLEEDPAEHEKIAATVLRRFFEADSQRSPLVMVLEDLQHADEASLDLIQEMGESLEGARIVLVAVMRPGLRARRPGWGISEGDITEVGLGPLLVEEAQIFLKRLLRRAGELPERFVQQAVEMTGGNPLFLQQLLLMLAEQRILDTTPERWTLDLARFAEAELPLSVDDAIEARVMALTVEQRQVLEMAVTMGNVFWLGALVMLSRLAIEEEQRYVWRSDEVAERLQEIVDGLEEREYIIRMPDSWIPGEKEYLFKHNLEFGLIESTSDPQRRRRNHRFVAQWLESRLGSPTEDHFEFLAQQYEAGRDPRRAALCHLRAADLAREKFANEQALRNYRQGLALLEPSDVLDKIDTLHSLGAVCALVGRKDEALKHFTEMLRLAWLLDVVNKGGAALGRIARIHRERGEYEEAMERYRAAQGLFKRAGDRRGLAATLDDIGKVHWLRGEYKEALTLHRRTLEMRREIGDERSTAFTLANIGAVYQDTGQFKGALRAFEESLAIRRRIDDRIGMVDSLRSVGAVFQELGELERAKEFWEEGLQIARETGDRLQQGWLLIRLGDAQRRRGDLGSAQTGVDEAAEIANQLGDDRLRSEALRLRGRLRVDGDALSEGRDQLIEALRIAEKHGYPAQTGSAHRALAEVAAKRSFAHEAEERFEKAMEIFSEMGNHLEVARCCDAMAAYYDSTGGAEKAQQLRESARDIRTRLLDAAGRDTGDET